MTTTTAPPPAGWYATAEGSHERYWDGETWSAPRRRHVHVVTHPKPEPEADKVVMPEHPYRDLPKYATVPPFVAAAEVFQAAFGSSRGHAAHPAGARSMWAGTGCAWLAAVWPALATFALLGCDVAGLVPPALSLWVILAGWVALAIADTYVVGRRLRGRGLSRPGTDAPRRISWMWGLIPPAEILARTRVAHSTRLIPFVLHFAVAFPVVWFMPEAWVVGVDGALNGLTSGAASTIKTLFDAVGIPT